MLIVDDLPENRAVLEILLSSLGFEIQCANNGKEAIKLFQSWKPDVILMDMVMPIMDGKTATKLIREMEEGEETGIVAVSASAFDEEREEILQQGANYFVRKPYDESDLLRKIQLCTGVEYVFEEDKHIEKSSSQKKDITDLKIDLPLDKRTAFVKAIDEGDLAEIEALSKTIEKSDEELYALIQSCIEQMDLDALQEVFNKE